MSYNLDIWLFYILSKKNAVLEDRLEAILKPERLDEDNKYEFSHFLYIQNIFCTENIVLQVLLFQVQ